MLGKAGNKSNFSIRATSQSLSKPGKEAEAHYP
jgi:hypothetical protein